MADFLQNGMQVYQTDFIALNNSGVAGTATVLLDSATQTVRVDIQASGLEAGQVHIQHIHGFDDDSKAMTPKLAQDADHDGFVELGEGLATYGPIQLNLSLNPDDSAHDHGTAGHDHTGAAQFPTADASGHLRYTETFHFAADNANGQAIFAGITPLDLKEVVIHGESVAAGSGAGTTGEVDGSGGYKAVLPVASGELHLLNGQAEVIAALGAFGDDGAGQAVNWAAIGAQVEANFAATGHWFL
jgi:hypothetical protein